MNNLKSAITPAMLREKAERCFLLAHETTDYQVHDLLVSYGHELLERAYALTQNVKGWPERTSGPLLC